MPAELAKIEITPIFDFHQRFEELTGSTVSDFIAISLLAYVAAECSPLSGFTRGYFEKARLDGLTLGKDDVVQTVLRNLAADSTEHARISLELQQPQRDYAAYDFSSLMVYPVIRPWPTVPGELMDLDRMIAPIPGLIPWCATSGIYYDMRNRWKTDFDQYFGHLLNAYVGRILKEFVQEENLISEAEIRQAYPPKCGKVPDWVVIDRKTAILIEVKVSRMQRVVYATGNEDKLSECLDPVVKGLMQMFEFHSACARRDPRLQRFARCKEFIPTIITMESLYLSGSEPYKDKIRDKLPENARGMKWALLCLDDLEWAQVHLSGGNLDIPSFFRHALVANPHRVVEEASKASQHNFGHSVLIAKEDELYERLGVPNALSRAGGKTHV